MKTPLSELKLEDVREGKICKHDHTQRDGRGVRMVKNGICLGCYYRLPGGVVDIQFDALVKTSQRTKYATAEEAYAAHVQRVMAWGKKNKDKVKVYQKKYSQKPERIEKSRNWYRDLPEEEKEKIRASRREHYHATKDTRPPQEREVTEEQKERRRRQQREYYRRNKEKQKDE